MSYAFISHTLPFEGLVGRTRPGCGEVRHAGWDFTENNVLRWPDITKNIRTP